MIGFESYIYVLKSDHENEIIIPISVCRLRERGRMSKSVYVRAFHDLELLRYVLRCAIERQL